MYIEHHALVHRNKLIMRWFSLLGEFIIGGSTVSKKGGK